MRIGIPIEEDRGLDSLVCAHFGGAPGFVIVDTAHGSYEMLSNAHGHHAHGQCVPVDLLREQRLDVMLVAGIGRGAMTRLGSLGVRVCRAQGANVKASIAALLKAPLELSPDEACAGHEHGH